MYEKLSLHEWMEQIRKHCPSRKVVELQYTEASIPRRENHCTKISSKCTYPDCLTMKKRAVLRNTRKFMEFRESCIANVGGKCNEQSSYGKKCTPLNCRVFSVDTDKVPAHEMKSVFEEL